MGASMDTNLDLRHARHGVTPPVDGAGVPYVSPYGRVQGLVDRLDRLQRQLREAGLHKPFYGGLIRDLEVVVRLLNVREFAEHLRVHGDADQAPFAADILELLDSDEAHEALLDDIERVLPVAAGEVYGEVVEGAAKKAVERDAIRAVLVNAGAITADDTNTDLPALIRALLS